MAFSGGSDPTTFGDLTKAWDETDKQREINKQLIEVIRSMTMMAANMSQNAASASIYNQGKAALEKYADQKV